MKKFIKRPTDVPMPQMLPPFKISDLEGYVSPIKLTYETALKELKTKEDEYIHAQIEETLGVKIDRDRLLNALKGDREQYKQGFAAGYAKRDKEIIRCGECKYRSQLVSEDSYGVEDWVCDHDCGCAQCEDDDFCRYGERRKK